MEQDRDADAVDVVTDVAGRRAAHVEIRDARRERRDAGHALDGAERIAERAREEPHLGARQRRRRGHGQLAVHGDLERPRLSAARRCGGLCGLLGCCPRGLLVRARDLLDEMDDGADARGDDLVPSRRRREPPRGGARDGRARERLGAEQCPRGDDDPVHVDGDLERDVGVAVRALG